MTTSTVNLRGVVGGGSYSYPTPKVQGTGGETDFSQILGNATGKDEVPETDVYENKAPQAEQEAPVEEVQEPEQSDVRDVKEEPQGVTESEKPDNVEVSEDDLEAAMEVIQSAVLEIRQLLCEELGISEEELLQALNALEMSETDLLATGNVTKLALYVEGQNEMALLTDEELYNTVQNLESAVQQISDELMAEMETVSTEDADGLFEQALKSMNETGVSKEAPVVQVTGEQVAAVTGEQGEKSDAGEGENQTGANLLAGNQNLNNLQQTVNAPQNTEVVFDMEQTQMIMDQIMERMNVQLGAEETTLEMQLHPEELGTLQITISAKEGVMTAQFTAESEAVKSVLENQIVQLQNKLEQQNVKVEAIEISVATHGFEQNLEQGRESNDSYQEEEKKQRVRKIDISSFDAVEELPEEDQVVAEMMQLHGNRVDYMA